MYKKVEKPFYWQEDELELAIRMKKEGCNYAEISQKIGRSCMAVYLKLRNYFKPKSPVTKGIKANSKKIDLRKVVIDEKVIEIPKSSKITILKDKTIITV